MVKATEVSVSIMNKGEKKHRQTVLKGVINTDSWLFTPDATCPDAPNIAFMREANFKMAENEAKTSKK